MSCDISVLRGARDLIGPRVVKWNKAAALVRTESEHKSDGRSRILRPHCMLTHSHSFWKLCRILIDELMWHNI
jgi:hypothetical protein